MKNIVLAGILLLNWAAWSIETIDELDDMSVFNFIILADNKGIGPNDSNPGYKRWFNKMLTAIDESGTEFVLGMGDNVKKGRDNTFVDFIEDQNNTFWQQNFYPNVADGENELFGSGQGDYAGGIRILELVDTKGRSNVEMGLNDAEYYAHIEVEDFTVHIIQCTFSDSPGDADEAWPEQNRQWMLDKVASIPDTQKDIIVVLAHSLGGNFVEYLSDAQQQQLYAGADVLVSGTRHLWDRRTDDVINVDKGALNINAGSLGAAANKDYSNNDITPDQGYVQIHVLDNPVRLVFQYQIVDDRFDTRILHDDGSYYDNQDISSLTFMYQDGEITEKVDWGALTKPVSNKVHEFQNDDLSISNSLFSVNREIEFFVSQKARVTLSLFDGQGRYLQDVYNRTTAPGSHTLDFETTSLTPGVYFLQGFAGQNKLVVKFLILR